MRAETQNARARGIEHHQVVFTAYGERRFARRRSVETSAQIVGHLQMAVQRPNFKMWGGIAQREKIFSGRGKTQQRCVRARWRREIRDLPSIGGVFHYSPSLPFADVYRAIRITDGRQRGMTRLAGSTAGKFPNMLNLPFRIEDLDAAAIWIGHEEFAAIINAESEGAFPIALRRYVERANEIAFRKKYLDQAVARIGHVNSTASVYCDCGGTMRAGIVEGEQRYATDLKFLDRSCAAIRNVDSVLVVYGWADRIVELSWIVALHTPLADEFHWRRWRPTGGCGL